MSFEMSNSMSYNDDNDSTSEEERTPRHTQFLDLTNGEGGARSPDHANEQQHPDEQWSPGAAAAAVAATTAASLPDMEVLPSKIGSGDHNPATPGKVVETGQEHTGRWTREEHAAFLAALKMYGKEWKKVAAKVKTRTVVQTRTHAQKYFQKLHKAIKTNESPAGGTVDMGVDSKTKARTQQRKLQMGHPKPKQGGLVRSQSASTHAAAHLMANLSSTGSGSGGASSVSYGGGSSAFGSAPYSTAQISAPSSFTTHGFSSASNNNDQPLLPPQALPSYRGGLFGRSGGSGSGGGMSIVAPEHDIASRMGKFPEPSPAATGKRKLAEIAAAQMLAGVIGGKEGGGRDDSTPPPPPPPPPPPDGLPDLGGGSAAKKSGLSLQIVNPETLGVTYDESNKRKRGPGGSSPTTPWDDDLDAFVSEKLKQESQQDAEGESDYVKLPAIGATPFMHPICGPSSAFGRSNLHRAVCDMNVSAIQHCATGDLERRDEAGYCPLHTAAALSMLTPSNLNLAFDICQLLISAGADTTTVDSNGNTPLHWAARAGNERVAHLMLLKNSQTDVQNNVGETPLHWAMRAGLRGMPVVKLLVENGAVTSTADKQFKRPVDVAVEGFADESDASKKSATKGKKSIRTVRRKPKSEVIKEKREVRANLLALSAKSRTLVLHHPECLEHVPKSVSDWECPDRVVSIMEKIMRQNQDPNGIFPHEVTISSDFDRASLEVLSRVHSAEYLSFVNKLSKDLEKKQKEEMDNEEEAHGNTPPPPAAVPFTPMVQRKVMKEANLRNIKQADHSDTSFSAGSLRAARRAAGAVQHAVDCVLVGRNRNAFCVVRPPGHHAGVQGLLAGGESCGFCIFNNVAAGAMHAISDERALCKRVAIVDLDVHHGNGTEEVVKKCHDPARLLFFSIHLYDNDKRRNKQSPAYAYKFYPGTGEEDEIPYNIINVPITPMWREQNGPPKPAPSPPAIPPNTHNTRQKVKQKATNSPRSIGDDKSSDTGSAKASDTESDISSRTAPPPKKSAPVSSPRYVATGRNEYRRAIQDRLLPALRAFNPDLIILSTGLDAAKGDVGNARHYVGGKEAMGLDLEPQDYAWATRKVLEIADICCHGRVVSVLEGGYGRTPVTPPGDPEEPQPLDKTVFSECALRHLQAMVDPYDAEVRYPGE